MKTVAYLLSGAALVYTLLCTALFIFQRQLLYLPQPLLPGAPPANINVKVKDLSLQGWVINPGQDHGLIYYGGNGDAIEGYIPLFKELFSQHTIYLIPYRGYSGNPGTPTEKNLYRDALAIFDQIKTQHTHISIIGRSLGSGVASYTAANGSIDKLALITPFDSIRAIAQQRYPIFPAGLLLKDAYDSIHRAGAIKASTLIVIAEQDKLIPKENSLRLANAFEASHTKTIIIGPADHNNILDNNSALTKISQFINAQ